MSKKTWIIVVAVVVILVGLLIWDRSRPGEHDAFAQCLAEEEVTFFGAFWCPHCQEQKSLFGRSERLIPYVECSTPDGRGVTQECIDEGIEVYPTWEFAGGQRETGVLSLSQLSARSGCEI